MLIGVNDCQALKFEVKTVRGRDFLLVERGGFNVIPESDVVVIPKGLALRLSCSCEAVAAF